LLVLELELLLLLVLLLVVVPIILKLAEIAPGPLIVASVERAEEF